MSARGVFVCIGPEVAVGKVRRIGWGIRERLPGAPVRLSAQGLYSVQLHGSQPEGERPTDWDTGQAIYCAGEERRPEYGPRRGDILVCLGTEDRYNYAKQLGLDVIYLDSERWGEFDRLIQRSEDQP